MSNPGRGFGLTPRKGRGNQRQQPSNVLWITVNNTSPSVRITESLEGPLPNKREKVDRKFTTYCALHLGHPRRAAPKKVELIRHLFNLVRMADDTAAIQPYMPVDTVNSVCHAHHISKNTKDFEHCFPEVKYYNDKIRTKFRFFTSISIKAIKNKIWSELRKHNFWMEPTQIKCHETARCDFFLYAHPLFTYRHDFVEILTPILLQKIREGPDFEYDVQPEKLTVTAGMNKTSEKVVMLRTTPTYCEEVQSILTNIFSESNETNITNMFLSRSTLPEITQNRLFMD